MPFTTRPIILNDMTSSPDATGPIPRHLPLRFSLITLIVAVNVAGVFLWANMGWTQLGEPREMEFQTGGKTEKWVTGSEGQGYPYIWRSFRIG